MMFLLPCFMQKRLGERNLKNMTLHIHPFLLNECLSDFKTSLIFAKHTSSMQNICERGSPIRLNRENKTGQSQEPFSHVVQYTWQHPTWQCPLHAHPQTVMQSSTNTTLPASNREHSAVRTWR